MTTDYKEKNYDIGVLIGRWQVPELHDAHQKLIEKVIEKHKKILILVGVTSTLGTKNDPLDYPTRTGLFKKYLLAYPEKIIIEPVQDVPGNDEKWSTNLDNIIRTIFPLGSVCLYGGRESFIDSYTTKTFDTYEYNIITPYSGTLVREETGKSIVESSDFRKGVIYASQNKWPQMFQTVDIAVVRKEKNKYFALMGIKKNRSAFAFPGGFVDPKDDSLESAAIRELYEEIDVSVDEEGLKYVGSTKINDYRYRGEEKIITAFFYAPYISGGSTIIDEFTEVEWIEVKDENSDKVSETHLPLFEALIIYLKEK